MKKMTTSQKTEKKRRSADSITGTPVLRMKVKMKTVQRLVAAMTATLYILYCVITKLVTYQSSKSQSVQSKERTAEGCYQESSDGEKETKEVNPGMVRDFIRRRKRVLSGVV